MKRNFKIMIFFFFLQTINGSEKCICPDSSSLWQKVKNENNIFYSALFESIKTLNFLATYIKFSFSQDQKQFRESIKKQLDEKNKKDKEKIDELLDRPKTFLFKSALSKLIFISSNVIFFIKIYPNYLKKRHWTIQCICFYFAPKILNLFISKIGLEGY